MSVLDTWSVEEKFQAALDNWKKNLDPDMEPLTEADKVEIEADIETSRQCLEILHQYCELEPTIEIASCGVFYFNFATGTTLMQATGQTGLCYSLVVCGDTLQADLSKPEERDYMMEQIKTRPFLPPGVTVQIIGRWIDPSNA